MLEALYEIGKIQPQEGLLNEIAEDIGNDYKHVFKIVFEIKDDNIPVFKEIGYEEFSSDKKLKYFYKSGSGSNGPDVTPTSKVTQLSKTYNKKILKAVLSFKTSYKSILDEKDIKFLDDLNNALQDSIVDLENTQATSIYDMLKKFVIDQGLLIHSENIKKDETISDKAIITLCFQQGDEFKYIGDIETFTKPFITGNRDAYKEYYYSKTRNENCFAVNSKCYICKETKPEVWGLVNTFQFYTIDKQGMVSGGFNTKNAWKNYPVCPECAKVLDRGKKYIKDNDNNLRLKFCGFNYFLIPQLTITDDKQLKSVLDRIKQKYSDFDLQGNKANRISQLEEKVLAMLADENNSISFNFFFFVEKQNGKVFNILLFLQEIAPTRLKYLIDSKKIVDDTDSRMYKIFNPEIIKNKKSDFEIDFEFSFSKIRHFFSFADFKGKPKKNFNKDFLAIVNNIFLSKTIEINFLLNRIMDELRSTFIDAKMEEYKRISVLSQNAKNGYKILIYLEQIKLLNRRRSMMINTSQPYFEFFQENSIMDTETKRALFLEGVLAAKLLEIQGAQKRSRPFMARLNGKKIDGKIAQRLLPEMINKLEEYKSNGKRLKELESAIGVYMLKAEFEKYSLDELSFYFSLGMTLYKHIIPDITNEDKTITTEVTNV